MIKDVLYVPKTAFERAIRRGNSLDPQNLNQRLWLYSRKCEVFFNDKMENENYYFYRNFMFEF